MALPESLILVFNTWLRFSTMAARFSLFFEGGLADAERWKGDYVLAGADGLELHHLYRAMAWLGRVLPEDQQQGSSKLVPRSTKDVIEEHLFARRRDLERVQQVEVEHQGKHFLLRSELTGTAGKILQAAGLAVPPTVQQRD